MHRRSWKTFFEIVVEIEWIESSKKKDPHPTTPTLPSHRHTLDRSNAPVLYSWEVQAPPSRRWQPCVQLLQRNGAQHMPARVDGDL